MSRTVFSIKTNADPNVVMQFLSIELPRIGYANKSTAYEPVWKRGDGVMIKAQCISVSFLPGEVVLSAWLYDAILGESNLEGFVGKPLKTKLRRVLDELAPKIAALPSAPAGNQPQNPGIPQSFQAGAGSAAASAGTTYCPNCGAPCQTGHAFCTKCGARL